ncbi:MAG: hypothetical protein K0R81_3053 [Microbacterium sp.]|nr:hypothetical protein [Microbacterium sp.]
MSNPVSDLVLGFQNLVAEVPDLVQPLVVALAGAVPFIEGEGAAAIGIIGGIPPVVAALAGAIGNLLCVAVVVLATSRVRTAVTTRRGGAEKPTTARQPARTAPAAHAVHRGSSHLDRRSPDARAGVAGRRDRALDDGHHAHHHGCHPGGGVSARPFTADPVRGLIDLTATRGGVATTVLLEWKGSRPEKDGAPCPRTRPPSP